MLDIAGFRGLTYDPARVDLSQVIAPPYDVISAAQRASLAQRSPYNFVRIDLPEPAAPLAHADPDRYRAAAQTLASYQASGVLRRDATRSLYRYHQEFTDRERNRSVVRKGVLAAVALSPWSAGVIRRHERTFAAAREDRARMLEATRVHLSPVFATYEDDARDVERLLERHDGPPDLAGATDDGTQHRVWRISDAATIAEVARLLAPKHAYMLDGHHRYETMVAFRDREAARGAPAALPGRGLMFLVPMSDPGLIVLPTHRLIHGLAGLTRDGFLAEARRHARVERIAGAARDAARLRSALAEASEGPAFAAVFPGDPDAHLLIVAGDPGAPLEPEVAVLHRVILERALGAASRSQADERQIRYLSDTGAALDEVAGGRAQLALLVRPPRLAQIKQLSDLGQVMPQKSTYFYPKLASGLVMMPVEAE